MALLASTHVRPSVLESVWANSSKLVARLLIVVFFTFIAPLFQVNDLAAFTDFEVDRSLAEPPSNFGEQFASFLKPARIN